MNYQWHYDRLIETRKDRQKEDGIYYERHHIVMKSMGGSNDDENLIYLTAREHFLAHWLLLRIYKNKHTSFAFNSMANWKNEKIQGEQRRFSSRGYQEARECHSKFVSELNIENWKNRTIEERIEISRKGNETLGKEGRLNRTKAAMKTMGKEGLSARSKKMNENLGEEKRKAKAFKTAITIGHERRVEISLKRESLMSPESKTARAKKGHATRVLKNYKRNDHGGYI